MAKLRTNSTHAPLRGKFGDKIYKWYGNTCVVQKLPTRRKRRRVTARLKAAFDNLRQAVRYAQGVIVDPAARAYYASAARTLRRTVYLLAKADAMKPPTIKTPFVSERCYEGRIGEVFLIATGDVFRVQTLRIIVRDAAGDIVETGDAVRHKKDFLYRLKREHPRGQVLTWEAVAESRPGHRVSAVQQVSRAASR
jgi:hypothetical protein